MQGSDTDYEPGLDVVVVNYRTPNLVKDFVDSYLYQTSDIPTDLIVVDVDPTEDSEYALRDVLSQYNFQYQYWPIHNNCGYSGACNFAATTCNREVIAFFNSDTKLFDDTLDVCYQYLVANEDTAACGPLQVDSAGRVTHAGIFGTNSKPYHRGWRSNSPSSFTDVVDDVVSVSGSAYFVNKRIWDELANDPEYLNLFPNVDGAFLPTQHYYEETWFSYFARHRGYKIAYIGSTMMIHEWHKSSKVGSVEGEIMRSSQELFRNTCDYFGIDHD